MADAILGSTVQVLVEMAINFACGKIGQSSELEKDLKNLRRTMTLIQDVLHDAEKRQVNEHSVKHWLEDLERVAFNAENLLDTFNYEMIRREVENQNQRKRKLDFFSFPRSDSKEFHSNMASEIQKINADFISINEQASKLGLLQSQNVARDATAFMENRETDSVTVDTSFVGRDDDVSAIVIELTDTSNNETISVLPIVGMGGIGKTTVARKVFNNLNIENHFDERMWVCVSDFKKHFDANRLFGLMLESLKVPMPEVTSKEAKVGKLKELLDGKEPSGKKPLKYLLVLDDVWNEDPAPWAGFLASLRGISSAKGSWILLTTRNKQVANITAIPSRPCSLAKLSEDNCWLILEKTAFGSRKAPDDLKELGLELAKKCQGLPLAASVLGGMLRNKESDVWRSILEAGLQNIGGDGDGYITKILKLSFDHLPYPALKKCFAYCSIFPQDLQMERNQLIQLWAAQGFLHSNPRNKMCMEEVGNEYFTILLDTNLFQDAKKDAYGNVLNCKMHDLVHDMVQSISESKTLRLKESTKADFPDKTFRYLAMERSDGEEILPFPQNRSFRCITTLFLLENRSIDDGLIIFLACLRVLSIASSNAKELPKSIGKLSHLRYLDSSDTPMETLPDSLCKLYNLQTLRLRDCRSLRKFPNNFKNLVNLRHFDFFPKDKSSDLTPLEIGQLRSLQTLPFFNIGEESSQKIGQLESLKNLSGSFEIRNLQLVRSMEEAKSAKLIEKANIDELRLMWNDPDNSRENDSEYNQVLEGLQAHQNLKGLTIERFFGNQLSTWIGKLGRLMKFKLQNCKSCKELPTLGNMPSLRSLHLEGLDSLTSIGPSFYGRSGMHSGSTSQGPLKLFPVLERLILKDMPKLREWTEATFHDGTVVVFPVLHTMRITNCPQLATFPIIERFFGNQLPTWIGKLGRLVKFKLQNCKSCKELPTLGNMPSIRSLHLEGLDSLTSIGPSFYGRSGMHSGSTSQGPLKLFPALERLILKDMPKLREWTEATFHDGTVVVFPVLHTMRITNCPQLATFPSHFPRLKKLEINSTQNGSVLMGYICSGVSTLTSLSIMSVNGLTKLPNVLFQNNPKLAYLELRDCGDLTQFSDFSFDVPQTSEGPNCQSVAEYTCIDNNAPQHLVGLESLEELIVWNCPSLESISIPKGRKYLTALRELRIQSCIGLTHLSIPQISESEWDSTSSPFSSSGICPPPVPLEELGVSFCPNLISFPIDLTRTPFLYHLYTSPCEKLSDLPKGKLCSLTRLRYLYIGPFSETTTELHSFLDLFDALPPPHPYFPSLSILCLHGWPHWESLPEQLQHLSALRELRLYGFGVKSLSDWLGKLSSLEELYLWDCEKLENLPSHQSMRSLTRLRELWIMNCPLLKERCNPENSTSSTDPNSEWSKISHIRSIEIDSEQIRG